MSSLKSAPVSSTEYGILELVEHPVGGLGVELGLGDRVDVEIADVAQDVIEQAGLLVHAAVAARAALQEPPAAQEGERRDEYRDAPAMLHVCLHLCASSAHAASARRSAGSSAFKCCTPGPDAARYAAATRA